ncbi:hypothetical protein CEXT_462701 [Caerostris extrusa]|uniref:Uncharacterized protein n=1 Tax=Caerostris extrusa TaxID=172846 RepID=A0AAV4YBU1_CAEEX|nr:hypothetical protein CEXT_462701 [Caerostris extrusa]
MITPQWQAPTFTSRMYPCGNDYYHNEKGEDELPILGFLGWNYDWIKTVISVDIYEIIFSMNPYGDELYYPPMSVKSHSDNFISFRFKTGCLAGNETYLISITAQFMITPQWQATTFTCRAGKTAYFRIYLTSPMLLFYGTNFLFWAFGGLNMTRLKCAGETAYFRIYLTSPMLGTNFLFWAFGAFGVEI